MALSPLVPLSHPGHPQQSGQRTPACLEGKGGVGRRKEGRGEEEEGRGEEMEGEE